MRKRFWKKYGYGLLVAIGITFFTGYVLLDVFVIPRAIAPVETRFKDDEQTLLSYEVNQDDHASSDVVAPSSYEEIMVSEPIITEKSYQDERMTITISTYRVNETDIYVADIVVQSPELLQTALADDTYGRNITQTTSQIADAHDAILAVNGDFYGARSKGYVIRNGVLYRSTSAGNEDLVIFGDGSMEIVSEKEVTAKELLERGAVQVLSFGPALLEDGELSVGVKDEVGKAMASNPRTAFGLVEENHYVFVVSDGRTSQSTGLSLYELAEFMQGIGVKTAYNLDGGGSSTMYFMGTVVNNPTTGGKKTKERSVSDILYVG